MVIVLLNKKLHYICEFKINGKVKDREKTDDYEVWYDKVTDKVYEVNGFKKIEIKIETGKF